MPDDVRQDDEDIKETYSKVDKREWLQEEDKTQAATEEESCGVGAEQPEEVGRAEQTAEKAAAEAPGAEPPPDESPEGPPLDTYGVLRLFLSMCLQQAWVQLGVQLAPGAQETKTDLRQAKLAIDTVAYLAEALADNLQADEKREVQQVLANLRLNYVQRT